MGVTGQRRKPMVPGGVVGDVGTAEADERVAILQARGVALTRHGRAIVKGIDLDVRRGEMLGLIGPNGAGKSTLMRVLAGIARPTGGTVRFEGRPLDSYSDRERGRKIAVMQQTPHLGFAFPVADVVAMGRYPHKPRLAPLDEQDRRAIRRAMETAGVDTLAHRMITTLSGGEKQRAFLARALAQEPELLFLDEPTANLDVRYQLEILTLIRRLNRETGLTVVIAIHDLGLALRFCDRLAVLSRGELAATGPAADVLSEELIAGVFGVRAKVWCDPETGEPRVDYLSVV